MHNCMMSSSVTEVTSNGVPSFCIMINTCILALRVGSSIGTGSLPKAVAEDEVDIFELQLNVAMIFFVHERIQKLSQFSDIKLMLPIVINAVLK